MIVVMTMWLPRWACSHAGTKAHATPARHAGQHRQRQQQRRGQPASRASSTTPDAQPAQRGLAFGADVEMPAMEGHRDREAGEDEVGRVVQRVAPASALPKAPSSSRRTACSGLWPMAQHHQAGGRQRQRHVQHRQQRRCRSSAAARRGACFMPRACPIRRPSARSSALVARQLAGDAAAAHHQDAVGQRQDLVELGRDQQHRPARVAQRDDAAVDELDGADVDAAGRLADQQHASGARRTRARGRASAGCRRRTWPTAATASRGRTSKSSISCAALPSRRARGAARAGAARRRLVLVAEDRRSPRPRSRAPGRGEAGPRARARRPCARSAAGRRASASSIASAAVACGSRRCCGGRDAGQQRPAARTGRCRRRRRCRRSRRHALRATRPARADALPSRHARSSRLEHAARRGVRAAAVGPSCTLRPDHQLGQLGLAGRAAVSRCATTPPARITVTWSVTRHDLAQLVGDQHHGDAARLAGRAGCGTAGRPPAASARRWARRGSGCARRGTAP